MKPSFCLVALLVQFATLAYAGPKEDAAQKRREAEKLSEQGDYPAALAQYEAAEIIFSDPTNDLGRAQILMKLRRFSEANDAYLKFLKSGKAGKKQKEIERAIEDLTVILQTSVSCTSTPEGATVYLNSTVDAPLGVTPFTQNLPPGTHRLIFQKEGFDTLSQVVTVEAKSSQTLQVALPVSPAMLSLTATPAIADISINGEFKGKTPLEVKLPDGLYTIEASSSGFATQRKQLEVKAKQNYNWSIDLTQPPPGTLSLSLSPKNAIATLDGEVLSSPKSLTPGTYTITFTAPKHRSITKSVPINSDQEAKVEVVLEPEGIILQVKTNRPSFTLSFDGAPLSLDEAGKAIIPAGEHLIAFDAPSDSSWTQSVNLSESTSATILFQKKPSLVSKAMLGGGVGSAVVSGLFFSAGVIRAKAIRDDCISDPDFCQANIEVFEELDRERGVFLTTSLVTAVAAGGLIGYYLYRRSQEGETKVTFTQAGAQ